MMIVVIKVISVQMMDKQMKVKRRPTKFINCLVEEKKIVQKPEAILLKVRIIKEEENGEPCLKRFQNS